MAFILNIETATKNCSVCLSKDGVSVAVSEYAGEGYTHAEKLHVFIEEVLQKAAITYKDLTAVAVSMGPGSYTGLRIGVSAAKGFCYALNIPLIAIDTLELLTRKLTVQEGVIIPMIDARRMEAYTAVFNRDYQRLRETKAEIITDDSFSEIEGTIHLIGDGALKCREVLPFGKFVYHEDIIYPSALKMAKLSYDKYKISDTVDVAYFEPFYLKDFITGK
ncbi:tRNA (adenosine(37)-N6)-threonylcarbamoyltransferase complex dimerization subunit type 1 TsaB [Flavobacterium sp. NRK1]|uniref:tRNA (adenosine(37)-N6)-threonylcarbamoyltransferase complex dimerization subunit type 1 TsaB n=1 Tax=Flavobacterium sp. NRK1 TaxID=2954929 RepID=UPI0020937D8D|nr:tRNA (adenosine(37)-N6)-threonylcarbamoyltransferase complex dimerization subunit type 1 TsaB [Flavobacterium sp. NRK1]MCO6148107.1 tRNA (adenosine(37)-N6)-threonylcarbamoyltransferase complex dimerization subunit type 1 TsaB [Flavobacterium sp. NRK1]